MDQTNQGLSIPDDVQNNCWWTRQIKKSIPDDARNNCWWMRPTKDYQYQIMYKQLLMDERTEGIHVGDARNNCWWTRPRKDFPYQMKCKTTVDERDRWGIHTRWCTKQLLMDETDKEIHTRWCTKQLLMDETNQGLPILDHVQTTIDGWESWRNPCQMMYETTVDGTDQ